MCNDAMKNWIMEKNSPDYQNPDDGKQDGNVHKPDKALFIHIKANFFRQ